ncbi:conserved hypothetical protein [Ricinus communis]|uniref:Uncharacterized protein n=1 Tax=Ricinus communis TaxID=3988 RepID=B9T1Z6_RICCO|nr:conserved hypothetical protein [Ricinus communis]
MDSLGSEPPDPVNIEPVLNRPPPVSIPLTNLTGTNFKFGRSSSSSKSASGQVYEELPQS